MTDHEARSPFPLRGLKGLWWEPEQYLGWPAFLAETGYDLLMLCYTFAPETALTWRQPLRDAERDVIRQLAEECRAHGITLSLALHPLIGGLAWTPDAAPIRVHPTIGPDWFLQYWRERRPDADLQPDPPIRYGSDEDLALLVEKCRDAAALGVTSFALCLDDVEPGTVPAGFSDLATAHAWLVRGLHAALADLPPADLPPPDARPEAQPDDTSGAPSGAGARHPRLFVVPTYYWTEGARAHPEYTDGLAAALPPDVAVFWTGSVVRDHAINAAKAREAAALFGRKPVVWLNYASNDSFRFQAQLPPDLPPTADLAPETAGLLLNSTRQVGLARLDARIIGTYLADPTGYDHAAAVKAATVATVGKSAAILMEYLFEAYRVVPDMRVLLRDLRAGGKPFVDDLLEKLDEIWLQLGAVGPSLAMHLEDTVLRRDLARANRRLRLLMDGLQVLQRELEAADTLQLVPIAESPHPPSAHRTAVAQYLDTLDPDVAADARAVLLLGPA